MTNTIDTEASRHADDIAIARRMIALLQQNLAQALAANAELTARLEMSISRERHMTAGRKPHDIEMAS
jgi:hypothetical protein